MKRTLSKGIINAAIAFLCVAACFDAYGQMTYPPPEIGAHTESCFYEFEEYDYQDPTERGLLYAYDFLYWEVDAGSPSHDPFDATADPVQIRWTNTGTAVVRAVYKRYTGDSFQSFARSYSVVGKPNGTYDVEGGGIFCNWDSGSSVTVTLKGSQTGVNYWLKNSGDYYYKKSGTGGYLTWTGVRLTGTISVIASKTSDPDRECTKTMNNSVVAGAATAVPTAVNVGGGGKYCPTDLQGKSVTLDNSQSGVIYELSPGGDKIAGVTGKAIAFPPKKPSVATTYTVTAYYNGSLCGSTTMAGSATIAPGVVPQAFTVSGIDYCSKLDSGQVVLAGSQTGVRYQLHRKGVPYGIFVTKDDTGPITWDYLPAGGPYSVVATFISDNLCPRVMPGPTIKNLLPNKYTVSLTAGGTTCGSSTVTLSGGETTVTYQLLKDGVPYGATKVGLGAGVLNWTVTDAGIFTIEGTTTATSCKLTMNSFAKVEPAPTIDIIVSKYPCTYYFAPSIVAPGGCGVNSITWDLGDGVPPPAGAFDVFRTYANGTYTISLQVNFTCNGATCSYSRTKNITVTDYTFEQSTVDVTTDQRPNIINTSAATFSDAWALQFDSSQYSNKNAFANGERGVWRNNGQYVYKAQRSQSAPVNIAVDGTFTADFFDWQAPDVIPNWIKSNTITQYSGYSYELENSDVNNIYSAALYDYSGQLLTAEGSNMRNNEMAFTSFENVKGITGNLVFSTIASQDTRTLPVISGFGHMAIVPGDVNGELYDVQFADVSAWHLEGSPLLRKSYKTSVISQDKIICKKGYTYTPSLPTTSAILVFDEAPFPGKWLGKITIRKPTPITVTATIDNTVSHTGASSLKVTTTQTFPQSQLKLDADKTYIISAWVSVNNPGLATPTLGTNLGLNVVIKDDAGVDFSDIQFSPSGPIIEGWQQVIGKFIPPFPETQIDLRFRPGSAGTAWFDDVRIHPEKGMMKTYVYDLKDFRLSAILDEQNFASLFYYDDEGNLFLTKKETERGIKTVSENITYMK